jgi:hypothetical protein
VLTIGQYLNTCFTCIVEFGAVFVPL